MCSLHYCFAVFTMVRRDMSAVVYTAFVSFEWIMLLIGSWSSTIASSSHFMLSVTSRMHSLALSFSLSQHAALWQPRLVLLSCAICVVRKVVDIYSSHCVTLSTTHRDPVIATTLVRSSQRMVTRVSV